jgi:serine/threonine-protein kinase
MPVKTPIEFLEVIEKSKLLSASQLDAARQLCDQESDPKDVARSLIREGILSKWQALHLLAGRSALTLGKYNLLDQLKTEGRPRMILAEDSENGQNVAIGMLGRCPANQNSDWTARFLDAGRKLLALEHPSIFRIFQVDIEGDRCFVAMEPPSGQSLQQLIRDKGPLPTDLVVAYLCQVSQALLYADQRGVNHGNLCLESLMVDDQGTVRVLNLGVAGLLAQNAQAGVSDADDSDSGDCSSLPGWIPSDAAGADRDLLALGGVMFAMLTGKFPDAKPSAGELIELRPDVPEDLLRCFAGLMAADPDARYASMAEFVEAIGAAAVAKPPPVPSGKPKVLEETARENAKAESVAPETRKPATRPPANVPKIDTNREPGSKIVIPGLPDTAGSRSTTPGALAINTKTQGRMSKKRGPRKPAGKGRQDQTAVSGVPVKPSIPRSVLLMGGASLGGLLLLTVIVFLVVQLFSGSGQVQVADADSGAAAEVERDFGNPSEASAADAESDPVLNVGPSALAEETDPELPIAATPAIPPSPPPTEQVRTEDGAAPPPADSAALVSESEAGNEPAAPTTEPAGVEEQQAAAEPDETAVSATEPEPAKQKPDKPVRESAAKPELPEKAPFADMPARVDLPALNASDALEPKTLGLLYTVRTREGQCYIRMRGGEGALRGNRILSMRSADNGTAERDWEINLRDGSGGEELMVARLSLDDQNQLVFQWLPAAQQDPAAGHLANGALSMTCRGQTHVLSLRQPTQADMLEVNLKEAATRHTVRIDSPPDPSKIRVEIKNVQGIQHKIEPHAVMMAEEGEAWIKLQDGGGVLALRVEVDMRRDLQMVLTPYVQWTADGKPERLVMRQLTQAKAQRLAAVNQWGALVQKGQAFMKSKAPEEEKKQAAQHLRNYENELTISQDRLTKFQAFEQMLEKNSPQIEFRVFYDADGTEIDLLVAGS